MQKIPFYPMGLYRSIHREETDDEFGMNSKDGFTPVDEFEIYSSKGRKKQLEPMRNDFFRIALSLHGNTEITIGLETYQHGINTVAFTTPNQIFSISNVLSEGFGYYILFSAAFMSRIINEEKLMSDFPFFSETGVPFFRLSEQGTSDIVALFFKLSKELKRDLADREMLIRMGIFEMLITAKREYEKCMKNCSTYPQKRDGNLFRIYKQLVQKHFVLKHSVAQYANMMAITPNHLNRIVKEASGKTASDLISDMRLLESKVLLRHTDLSASEISQQLNFNDTAHFSKFFKQKTKYTPIQYRNAVNIQ